MRYGRCGGGRGLVINPVDVFITLKPGHLAF